MNKDDVDDTRMSMSEFQELIAVAKAEQSEWVETTAEIIKILQPRGLGKNHGIENKFFIYSGIKVCEYGKIDEIESECNEPMNNRLHGTAEARVVSGQ